MYSAYNSPCALVLLHGKRWALSTTGLRGLIKVIPLIRFCLLLVLMLALDNVIAADADRQYRVHAVAKVTGCAGLNEAAAKAHNDNDWGDFYGYSLYTMGYLSAVNRMAPDTHDIAGGMNNKNIMRWLRRHCAAHPEESFDRALVLLTWELYPQRSRVVPD